MHREHLVEPAIHNEMIDFESLELFNVYLSNDYPILFSCTNDNGIYLVNCFELTNEYGKYMVAKTTERILIDMLKKHISPNMVFFLADNKNYLATVKRTMTTIEQKEYDDWEFLSTVDALMEIETNAFSEELEQLQERIDILKK